MKILENPWRGPGLPPETNIAGGDVSIDPAVPQKLFQRCPVAHQTPLLTLTSQSNDLQVAELVIKDERNRLGLGSFKSLGAAYAIAKAAAATGKSDLSQALVGTTYVCASAGNHGLSMAAGARLFGATAIVYLSNLVPEAFAERLRAKQAKVVRAGEDYEASMAAALAAASDNGWQLLSDSSWPGYTDPARDVMEGYLIMASEAAQQMSGAPTHIFLQAGVGGLAAACAVAARGVWGDDPTIVVVEPEFAPALQVSIAAGEPAVGQGPASAMGRLDCKEPSHLALAALAREADHFMTISEDECQQTVDWLADRGLVTTPSGAAGIAGLRAAGDAFRLTDKSRVLTYLSEGPEDV